MSLFDLKVNWIFNLVLSPRDMLPSFEGAFGNIKYLLEAKICSAWMEVFTVKKELNFLPKFLPTTHLINVCVKLKIIFL